jgi:predicted ATP pyrophosphatase (TIGR00289 family)
MFHQPNLALLKKQAEELKIKLITRESRGEKELELQDLELIIQEVKDKINGIIAGGIASFYQGKRIKKICDKNNLEFILPLWNYTPEKVWQELLQKGFEVILTKISCEGIKKEFLGKVITNQDFDDLQKLIKKYGFRLDFEGGEAETAVLFMPGFKKHIKIEFDIKSEDKYRHFLEIKKVK